ncbi:hypothetical protein K2X05_14120 [bacterium]|nr:hypothetical protein [bacterium]
MTTNKTYFLFSLLALLLAGCSKGSISGSGASSSISGSLSVTAVYPTSAGESWTPIQLSARYYIKGLDLSIKGTCTRGIATVKVGESGSGGPFFTEEATCLNDGSYTWNKTFAGPLESDKTLTVVAFDIQDLPITATITNVDVRVDNVAPAAVVVTTPGSSPHVYNGLTSLFNIIGTCTTDTILITGPSGNITPSAGSWNSSVTVIETAATDYTFYAFDLAGNQSPGTTQTISWTPDLVLLVSSLNPGAVNTDGGTNFVLEASGDSQFGEIVAGIPSFTLDSGFNFITNSARQ